jgi:hypothetical protein
MQLSNTIFFDSTIFIEKKWWQIDCGKKLKFGGEKICIIKFSHILTNEPKIFSANPYAAFICDW